MEKPADHAPPPRAISSSSTGQEMAAQRDAAPPTMPHRSLDHARRSSAQNAAQERLNNDIWTSAISRLQAQVSYNTGMLESHRRQFVDIEAAVGRLNQQMNDVMHAVSEVQRDVHARPVPAEQHQRHDPGDLEVLAKQLQRLTNRVNEIDGLNMQLDLVKNRMKRLEDGNASVAPNQQRTPSAVFREPGPQDPSSLMHPLPQQQQQQQQHPQHLQQQQQQHPLEPPQHPQLPPMRTSSMASPAGGHPSTLPPHSAMDAQHVHAPHPPSASRLFNGEPQLGQLQPGSLFRPTEALPPPSALSGWRPAEQHRPGLSPTHNVSEARPSAMEPDVHPNGGSQPGAWSAVNATTAVKRSPENRSSEFEALNGSKRPRLAPLMPNTLSQSMHGEDGYGPTPPSFPSMNPSPSDVPFHPRSRAPSDGSQSQPAHHNFRFITSTQQPEPQEQWRTEAGGPPTHVHPVSGRGNGRGRGRGRGRARARGGPAGHSSGHEAQEHGTPEWERAEIATGRASPNGHFGSVQSHSPKSVYRSTPSGSFVGERPSDYPATPVTHGSPHDSHLALPDPSSGGSGKKTRTKPVRNAEGILIRKDGRPDMRSVSSANNLRKVHAKKEAERAENDEETNGHTRSGTPTSAAAGEDGSDDHGNETPQEKHRELMQRILSEDRSTRERSTPMHETSAPQPPKSESDSRSVMDQKEDSKTMDVVMRDSEAPPQVEGRLRQDAKPFAAPPPVAEEAIAA
ncbi:hypothetical protein CERZMDRAFT_95196 [Cercospora zeae-maydis SCOH1-5]|uniref:Uncharacterized protein n=1 Tax=Cercospora zeae-maydis SCOH1-5 TaxID=717836 RepID=A0A6A6FMZ9_9PEZI|nr:hypothetical protein CERZMDRAFT_95196 [Cercospora zeae-maydis SCOH1-5]